MIKTLGAMRADIEKWMHEPIEAQQANMAINDAIGELWNAVSLISAETHLGVTRFMPQNREHDLVAIPDPPVNELEAEPLSSDPAPADSFVVTYTLLTGDGGETLSAPPVTIDTAADEQVAVYLPTPFVWPAQGWNCYVDDILINENPLLPGHRCPLAHPDPARTSPRPPERNTTGLGIAWVERADVRTARGWQSIPAHDLNSLAARRLQFDYPTQYPLAWDIVNWTHFQLFPRQGDNVETRLFYVITAPKLAFDGAMIPLQSMDSEKFIRCAAMADLYRSLHEHESSAHWAAEADREKRQILMVVLHQHHIRNQYITPYRV